MQWYETLIAAHLAVTDQVSHAQRMKSDRYFVWQEDGSNDLEGDNLHADGAVTGATDLFTKQELDPWAEALGEELSSRGIAWSVSCQFEPGTGFWHYRWDWEVLRG